MTAGAALLAQPFVAFDALAQSGAVVLPFRQDDNDHVIVDASVNGEPVRAVIDNGASVTLLDAAFARSRNLLSGRTMRVNGGEVERSIRIDAQLGPKRVRLAPPLIDFAGFVRAGGEPYDMLVGLDVLRELVVQLDYDAARMTCWPAQRGFEAAGSTQLALRAGRSGLQTLEVEIEGVRRTAFFDLGASSALAVREGVMSNRWFDEGRRWTTVASGGIQSGAMALGVWRLTRTTSLKLGPFELADVPVQVIPQQSPTFTGFDTVVGGPAIARFLTTLDARRSRLWLKPNARFGERFRFGTVGAGAVAEGDALRVVHVSANSPAEAAGVREGDVILEIDGARATRDRITGARPGTRLSLKLAGGRTVAVTAAEFY
jgi:predicted aspartyl protease